MANLNVLGALAGAGRGGLQGLQIYRQREAAEEERERRERNDKIQLLRNTLPSMPKADAQKLLQQEELLGDDDKFALMAIAGTGIKDRAVSPETIEQQTNQMVGVDDPSINLQQKYDFIDGLISRSGRPASEQKLMQERLRKRLGMKTEDVGDFTYEDFFRQWQSTDPNDRQGLEKLAEKIGHPEWLDYVGDKPRKVSTAQGRTDEEIIDDQSRIIGRRIRDIDTRVTPLDKLMADNGTDHEDYPKWKKEKERLMNERSFLRDREGELGQPDAKPVKNLKQWLTPPKPKAKPKPGVLESAKGLPKTVGQTMLRKRALAWLKKNAPDAIDREKLTDDQIVENVEAVINQGLVK
jgi:hypothetical protein